MQRKCIYTKLAMAGNIVSQTQQLNVDFPDQVTENNTHTGKGRSEKNIKHSSFAVIPLRTFPVSVK